MAEPTLAGQTAGNPQPRGDFVPVSGWDDETVLTVRSAVALRAAETRDQREKDTLACALDDLQTWQNSRAGNPRPRGDFPPALITKIAALLAEANHAVMGDRKLPVQVAEARRALCLELGVQRNDEPRTQIETRLREALAGGSGHGMRLYIWAGFGDSDARGLAVAVAPGLQEARDAVNAHFRTWATRDPFHDDLARQPEVIEPGAGTTTRAWYCTGGD